MDLRRRLITGQAGSRAPSAVRVVAEAGVQ
jgi:hypothetical protein